MSTVRAVIFSFSVLEYRDWGRVTYEWEWEWERERRTKLDGGIC